MDTLLTGPDVPNALGTQVCQHLLSLESRTIFPRNEKCFDKIVQRYSITGHCSDNALLCQWCKYLL